MKEEIIRFLILALFSIVCWFLMTRIVFYINLKRYEKSLKEQDDDEDKFDDWQY